ncbi:MAG: branched-chain amino acid ABC transporter substrate-binding protein [Pseudomonadota bacterium]
MTFTAFRRTLLAASLLAASVSVQAQKAELVRIAFIDPLSGPAAVTGANQLKTAEFFAGILNGSRSGSEPRYEIIGLDSKLSPAEAVIQLHSAIAKGVRYISHGNGSAVALALSEAVSKYNTLNPGKEVLYINQAAIDSALTNEKCSYWHFRIDADVSMRMAAITAFVKEQPAIRKIYLLNQDYSFGRQVSSYAREGIRSARPDIEIVGDEFIPLSKTRDFAPIVEKIKASGADTVITGNWGTDMSLLAKASVDQGYHGKFLTFYADRAGTPQAFGVAGLGRVYVVAATHSNMGGMGNLLAIRFKRQYREDLQSFQVIYSLMLLSEGITKARSSEPLKVAAAMEGLSMEGFSGPVSLRRQDHQMQQGMFLLVMGKTSEKYPNGLEGTDYTLIQEKRYEPAVASTPSTCNMERPVDTGMPAKTVVLAPNKK